MTDRSRTLTPADLAPDPPAPPVAEKRPVTHERHGISWTDDYDWLRDKGYPEVTDEEVLSHLRAENAYFDALMGPYSKLIDTLFEEMKARIKEDDEGVPYRDGDYLYGWRFAKGAQYRTWYRKPLAGGEEHVILDETALADGLPYFQLAAWEVTDDGRMLAYSVDIDGSERFRIRFKDLETGEVLPDEITQAAGGFTWASDGRSLVWLEQNEQHRPFRARLHRLGGDPSESPVLYEEKDPGFFVSAGRTQSRDWIVINAGDHVTSELRLLPAADPHAEPRLVAKREPGKEYDLDEAHGTLYIRTNDAHRNFRVVTATVNEPGPENWKELIAPSDDNYIRGLAAFRDHLVLQERLEGLDRIRLRSHDEGEETIVELPEKACSVGLGANAEFHAPKLRLIYQSMVTPGTVFDYEIATRTLETKKVQEIPSGYDSSQYTTERLMAPARDGVKVPVTVVRRRDTPVDGTAPCHLYGYGAYGIGQSPYFSTARLGILDRGFIFAIAHVRGGDDLGYGWYEDGKLEKRTNTFHDFVDCTRFLIEKGYAAEGGVAASGGSAGGELMGAVINEAPELYRAVAAHVPFVDVLHTILDESLPLTPLEWPEWGNPVKDEAAFELIRSYCPYQNTRAQGYPPLLVTAGLSDPRVTYWEPAKWVAKLRELKTDENVLLLKTNMEAGHGGKSGRWERLREQAEEQAFFLVAFGLGGN